MKNTKLIAILLCVSMLLMVFVGCNANNNTEETTNNTTEATTEATVETTEAVTEAPTTEAKSETESESEVISATETTVADTETTDAETEVTTVETETTTVAETETTATETETTTVAETETTVTETETTTVAETETTVTETETTTEEETEATTEEETTVIEYDYESKFVSFVSYKNEAASAKTLSANTVLAGKFNVTSGYLEQVNVFMGTIGDVTFSLYKWNKDYETTLAGEPLKQKTYLKSEYAKFETVAMLNLELNFEEGEVGPGSYIYVLNTPEGSTNYATIYMG